MFLHQNSKNWKFFIWNSATIHSCLSQCHLSTRDGWDWNKAWRAGCCGPSHAHLLWGVQKVAVLAARSHAHLVSIEEAFDVFSVKAGIMMIPSYWPITRSTLMGNWCNYSFASSDRASGNAVSRYQQWCLGVLEILGTSGLPCRVADGVLNLTFITWWAVVRSKS